jgi:predicted RNase H-like HicB family nuclease
MRYAASVTRHDNGEVTVRVPDVPGAVTYGQTEATALARAQRVVRIVIHQLMHEQRPVPLPSSAGDAWIEIPPEEAAAIERYAARPVTPEGGVRHLMASLAAERRRKLREEEDSL